MYIVEFIKFLITILSLGDNTRCNIGFSIEIKEIDDNNNKDLVCESAVLALEESKKSITQCYKNGTSQNVINITRIVDYFLKDHNISHEFSNFTSRDDKSDPQNFSDQKLTLILLYVLVVLVVLVVVLLFVIILELKREFRYHKP